MISSIVAFIFIVCTLPIWLPLTIIKASLLLIWKMIVFVFDILTMIFKGIFSRDTTVWEFETVDFIYKFTQIFYKPIASLNDFYSIFWEWSKYENTLLSFLLSICILALMYFLIKNEDKIKGLFQKN